MIETEIDRALAEDPALNEEIGRARAKARGERYDPERHDPYRPMVPPAQKRKAAEPEHTDADFEALLERFASRPVAWGPKLVRGADRPDVRRVAGI